MLYRIFGKAGAGKRDGKAEVISIVGVFGI